MRQLVTHCLTKETCQGTKKKKERKKSVDSKYDILKLYAQAIYFSY